MAHAIPHGGGMISAATLAAAGICALRGFPLRRLDAGVRRLRRGPTSSVVAAHERFTSPFADDTVVEVTVETGHGLLRVGVGATDSRGNHVPLTDTETLGWAFAVLHETRYPDTRGGYSASG